MEKKASVAVSYLQQRFFVGLLLFHTKGQEERNCCSSLKGNDMKVITDVLEEEQRVAVNGVESNWSLPSDLLVTLFCITGFLLDGNPFLKISTRHHVTANPSRNNEEQNELF